MDTVYVALTNHGGVVVETLAFREHEKALTYLTERCELSDEERQELRADGFVELADGDNGVTIKACHVN